MPARILIADDDEIDYMAVKRICKSYDLSVDYAENGLIAWQKMQVNVYKLLITDIDMPEMDGLKLIEHLRHSSEAKLSGVKIAVVSGTLNQEIVDNCKVLGIDFFYNKPISKDGIKKIFSDLNLL